MPAPGPVPSPSPQQRLWFFEQLDPDRALYNIAKTVRLTGPLDRDALQKALDAVVRRHEILRTAILVRGGTPLQVVHEPRSVPLREAELSESDGPTFLDRVRAHVHRDLRIPFDLSEGLPVRALLLRAGPEDHVLSLVVHHMVSDGWSFGVMWKEMSELYGSYREGGAGVELAELPMQYGDLRGVAAGVAERGELEGQLSYWRGQLGGELPVLEMPTDRPRPGVQSYRGGEVRFELSGGLLEGLKELSRGEGVTLFMTMLAVFEVLLWRYSGQEEILVGTPIANRNRVETEGLIGFFVNTLVMRGDLSGDPRFREFLGRVRETALGAYAHQDVPFEQLVEELQPERSMTHTPLFHAMFAWRTARRSRRRRGLTLSGAGDRSRRREFRSDVDVVAWGGWGDGGRFRVCDGFVGGGDDRADEWSFCEVAGVGGCGCGGEGVGVGDAGGGGEAAVVGGVERDGGGGGFGVGGGVVRGAGGA